MKKVSNKFTNDLLCDISISMGDFIGNKEGLGESACKSCTEAYCCMYQREVGISSKEFDTIEHLITPEQIERARVEVAENKEFYRCPFLSEEGKCEIYSERFLICAMYSVIGTNKLCHSDNKGNNIPTVNPMNVIEASRKNEAVDKRMRNIVSDSEGTDILIEFTKRFNLKD
jgi:Fe-S-cluster containining protein